MLIVLNNSIVSDLDLLSVTIRFIYLCVFNNLSKYTVGIIVIAESEIVNSLQFLCETKVTELKVKLCIMSLGKL